MAETITFMVEDADIRFRNFSGEPTRFNSAGGKRTFCCLLDQETASQMAKDGWNIKHLRAQDEGDEDQPYIEVSVGYKAFPPKIYLITSAGRTLIGEDLVGTLDWADIQTLDFIARAYEWEVNDKKGIKPYVQTMFVTLNEDPLELKYAAMGVD